MTDLEGEYSITLEPVQVPAIEVAIKRAKEYLAKNDPWTAIGCLYGLPEVEAAGLGHLVWLLDKNQHGCSKGDVEGVIELLEAYLDS